MIPLTMMTLIKDNEREVTELDEPPPETVQKHLTNNNNDRRILKLVHELLPTNNTTLNLLLLRLTELIIPLPMHARHLLADPLPRPPQVDFVPVVLHVQLLAQGLVLDDAVKVGFYGLGLLFDQLDGVGQEDDFLLLGVGQVVVHGGDGDARLAQACGQVDYAVAVLALLEQGLLVVS